jgi:hypothetical protein
MCVWRLHGRRCDVFLRRLFGGIFGRERTDEESHSSSVLSDEERGRIGTGEDPMRGYEEAFARNEEAMRAEQGGDVRRAISLYERSVSEGFVRSQPYERLAGLYEQRRDYGEALRVTEAFLNLARSGTMPRGAHRSAEKRLPEMEARAERYRKLLGAG